MSAESVPPRGDARTDLAVVRSSFAAERTLMAWIRTSLAMISFGFSIGKLSEVLATVELKGFRFRIRDKVSVLTVAHFLVILGTLALLAACWEYRHRILDLRAAGLPKQRSLVLVVAITLVLVGWFALGGLVSAL